MGGGFGMEYRKGSVPGTDKEERFKKSESDERSRASPIQKNIDEATVKGVKSVHGTENGGRRKEPKFINKPVPHFLRVKELSEKDRKMLANQFTDSELAKAIEDAKSYLKKKAIQNHAAFLTERCKQYRKKCPIPLGQNEASDI